MTGPTSFLGLSPWVDPEGRFSARLVVPGDGPPIPNGVIEVADGMITDLFPGPDNTATDLGNVVLLPGLVNAHTHLEFSATTVPFPANEGMAAWIGEVVTSRRTRTTHTNPVRTGLDELNASGTAAVGEIATTDWPTDLLHEDDPTCVVFREIIGLRPERCNEGITVASDFLDGNTNNNCRRGLSPHAPYSVHPDLYTELVGLAASRDVPLATHIAESPDELELLAHGTGPMRERLESLNAWDGSSIPRGSSPLDYLTPLTNLRHPLVIHGNLLNDREITWLSQHRHIAIVYCPRTHAHFGHPPHPWPRLLEQGTPVALGTDGRSSNPDLSMWKELQFLARLAPTVPAENLLAMATSTAAAALGLSESFGTLAPGKQAIAVGVTPSDTSPLSLASVLASGHLAGTLRSGRWHPA